MSTAKHFKGYFAGLGIYAALILLTALPIFPNALNPIQVAYLAVAAAAASMLVALLRLTGAAKRMKDSGAVLTQAVLGIGICGVLYSYVAPAPRPHIMFMAFLLWTAVGLLRLSPRGVLALSALFLAGYLRVFTGTLSNPADTQYADAVFMLIVSGVMGGFMFWRASEYTRVRNHKREQEVALHQAEARIEEITTQDSETTALKYAYFRNQLLKEKAIVDMNGGTFAVGLVEIDGYAELLQKIGETASGQVLREFTERITKLIRKTDTLGKWDPNYKPVGRISGGRFSLMLPKTDFEGAMRCAERLHNAVEFKAIRTGIGVVGVTLSIGITEYAKRESTDELMELAARALMLAKQHNGNDFRGLKRPQGGVTPTRAGLDAWSTGLAASH